MKKFKLFILFISFVLTIESYLDAIKIYHYNSDIFVPEDCDPNNNGEYLLLENFIKNGDVIFDVGANIGDYTKYILSLNRSNKIYSFEPILDIVEKFKINIGNHCVLSSDSSNFNYNTSSSLIFNFGFYKKDTIMPIWYAYSHDVLSSIYDRSQQPVIQKIGVLYKKINIKLRTIDGFCVDQDLKKIDFLKIDTEGAEYDVLLGADHMLSNHRITKIQFEYGACYLDSGYTLRQIYNYLTNFGYFIYKITSDGLIYIDEWHDSLEDYRYSNFLASLERLS